MTRPTLTPAAVAALLLALALPGPADAKTLRTITIDGNLDDWTEVLLDRDQKVADRSAAQGDPDMPSQAQRDERGVAFTWDATNLYLYFSRTGSGTNSFNAIFYMDYGHDRVMHAATDRVAVFKFTGSSLNSYELYRYNDGGTPDPMGGDGVSMPGPLGTSVTTSGGAASADSSGIGFECSITWASLGIAAGTPIFMQPALSTNLNLPGGIQDNTDLLDTFLVGVMLSPGATKGTAPGRTVDFPHRVTNDGTASDIIDLILRTRLGFALEIWSDPNGDGNPSDGALLGRDANGDGDMTDTGDIFPAPAVDANRNGFVDGGALAAGAVRNYVLRVGVPARQAVGTEEVVTVFAASGYKPAVRVQTEDRVRVGLVTIWPDRNALSAPGTPTRLAHRVCNDSGAAAVLDLTFDSLLNWTGTFWSDPNGDGDPADGAPLSDTDADGDPDVGSVPDGTCRPIVLVVNVPVGAPVGIRDDVDIWVSDGVNTATLLDTIRVVATALRVQPDRSGKGQRGKTLYFPHDLINSGPATDTFGLATTSTLGSATATMDDPNDDGDPDQSRVITSTGPVPGDGGRFPLITRVRIPAGATHGQVDTVRTTGTAGSAPIQDTATDTITVFGMLSYSDPLFARPSTQFFGQCSTIYVLAFRSGGGTYRFLWLDALGTAVRTSADVAPYSNGALDDFFDGGPAPLLGTWTVKLQEKQGASYVDVGPSGTVTFEMRDLVSGGARVSLNDTGADLYVLSGDALVAYADVSNPTSIDIIASRIEHVAYFDANGNGRPDAGEDYVRMNGTVAAWSAGAVTSSTAGLDVYSGETLGDRFVTQPVTYSRSGVWTLRTTWLASCGFLISSRQVTFTVGCSPPPTFDGILSATDIAPCETDGIRLDWDPVISWGLGGSGTYVIYRSTDPGFTPDASTLLAFGVTGTTYTDTTAVPGLLYSYVVRAENSGNCSDGPNNFGLTDSNFAHAEATDRDYGIPPVADFDFTMPACLGPGGATVSFVDLSPGPPLAWSWDFNNDGREDSDVPDPDWTFASAGDHPVTLRVTNPCGQSTLMRIVRVTLPPAAVIAASRLATCTDEPVDFDGRGSSAAGPATIVAWSWDFDGDGTEDSTADDPPPTTFFGIGPTTTTLTVLDSNGCEHRTSVVVDVHAELAVTLAVPVVDHCTGDVSVLATAAGGVGPYVFTWDILADDGAGTGTGAFPFGTLTQARVTLTDAAGCSATGLSDPIAINPELTLSLGSPVVDPCTGDTTLVATGGGGDGNWTFTFTNLLDDGTGRGRGVLTPGSYVETVTITDGEGCSAQAFVTIDVPDYLTGDFTSVVSYLGPGSFQADLTATGTSPSGGVQFTWDIGADGIPDGTGPTLTFPMGPQQTVTVELEIQDAAGCVRLVRHDVVSGGCPSDAPVQLVMVRKEAGGLHVSWQASLHPCHDRYDVAIASTARPSLSRAGTWPTDPGFTSVRLEDADGSPQDEQLALLDPRAGTDVYILVRDGGTDGTFGPAESYGSTGVGP